MKDAQGMQLPWHPNRIIAQRRKDPEEAPEPTYLRVGPCFVSQTVTDFQLGGTTVKIGLISPRFPGKWCETLEGVLPSKLSQVILAFHWIWITCTFVKAEKEGNANCFCPQKCKWFLFPVEMQLLIALCGIWAVLFYYQVCFCMSDCLNNLCVLQPLLCASCNILLIHSLMNLIKSLPCSFVFTSVIILLFKKLLRDKF